MARKQGAEEVLPLASRDESQPLEGPPSTMSAKVNSKSHQRVQPLVKHWRWEIFTFLLGTAAFATILGLLLRFHNKPPQSWRLGQARIQITAIIAALAQVTQSALLVPISYCIGQLKWNWFRYTQQTVDLDRFDLASRGPDGSIRLIFRLGWKQRLVSLGCIATVLILVLPAFIQAAVNIGENETEFHNDGHAVMYRSTNAFMNPASRATLFDATDNDSPGLEVDTYLSAALDAGFLGIGTNKPYLRYGLCEMTVSSKCAWAPFKTLALCTSSEDISGDIKLDSGHVILEALKNNVPISNGSRLLQSRSFLYMGESQAKLSNHSTQSSPKTSVSDGTNLPDLAEINLLYYNTCVNQSSDYDKTSIERWKAYRSRIQFCLQTVEEKYGRGGPIHPSETRLIWYKTRKFNETAFCTKVEMEEQDFCVSESLMESLSVQLSSMFNATAFLDTSNHNNIRYSSREASILGRDVFGDYQYRNLLCKSHATHRNENDQHSDPYVRIGLYGFQTRMDQVATSLTYALRTDHLSEQVLGSYKYNETLVLVDFRWLVLPGALYLAITIFFIATVLTTRDTPIWKSSPLPLLSASNSEHNSGSADEISRAAKKSQMQLRKTTTGWKICDKTESYKKPNDTTA